MPGFSQVCYLRNVVDNPQIEIGEYTYYDDPDGAENFERNVLYLFPFGGDRLVIGRFCAIARRMKFIMNGANHKLAGFSTYPFFIFSNGWEAGAWNEADLPFKGDTVVGHDVWLGYDAQVMPGVKIGHGAVVAARSVVTEDVPAYAIFGGNPARLLRHRFDEATREELLRITWWDWPVDKITRHLAAIGNADLAALRTAAGAD